MEPISIGQVVDRIMIEDVLKRYVRASDTTTPDLLKDVFSPDIQIELPDGRVLVQGIDKILAKAASDRTKFNPTGKDVGAMRHLITNTEISVEADCAAANYYVLTMAYNEDAQRPEVISFGRYEDRLKKTDGRWLITHRVMRYDWGNDEMARKLQIGPYSPK